MGLCLCNPLYSLRKTADRMHRRVQVGAKRAQVVHLFYREVIKDRLAAIRHRTIPRPVQLKHSHSETRDAKDSGV